MALEINILVGTMTSTAELVAQEIELTVGDDDTIVTITDMDGSTPPRSSAAACT